MKIPIGTQRFEKIIQYGYAYVNKRKPVFRLVTSGNICNFTPKMGYWNRLMSRW